VGFASEAQSDEDQSMALVQSAEAAGHHRGERRVPPKNLNRPERAFVATSWVQGEGQEEKRFKNRRLRDVRKPPHLLDTSSVQGSSGFRHGRRDGIEQEVFLLLASCTQQVVATARTPPAGSSDGQLLYALRGGQIISNYLAPG